MTAIRTETEAGVRSIVFARPDRVQHDHPGLPRRARRRDRRGRRRPRRARHPAARRGPGILRRLRARLVDGRAGDRGGARAALGLGRRPPHDGPLRRGLHEALVRREADDRRGAGLVHRRRHRHGAVRRHRDRRRGRDVRLPAGARLGHADDGDVGLPNGPREGEALSADRRRDPRARGGAHRPHPRSRARRRSSSARDGVRATHGAAADQPARHAEAALQPDRREHGPHLEPHARDALRRHRPPHPGGARFRRARPRRPASARRCASATTRSATTARARVSRERSKTVTRLVRVSLATRSTRASGALRW